MDLSSEIKRILEQKFNPQYLQVHNDSYKHAGHRKPEESINSHFRVEINYDFMEGTRMQKHRSIMESLKEYMDKPIHALEIRLK